MDVVKRIFKITAIVLMLFFALCIGIVYASTDNIVSEVEIEITNEYDGAGVESEIETDGGGVDTE